MNDLTPFQEKLSNTCATTLVVIAFALLIYFILVDICNDYYEKEYIKSLNEHDKAIISTYKTQRIYE